jgi:hemerythrin-like domain-containing protein
MDKEFPGQAVGGAMNDPTPAMSRALSIMKEEHRTIALVSTALRFVIGELRRGAPPDFALLRAMLHYIEQFPRTLHHPKEEAYLFRRLGLRTEKFAALLAELERQHAEGGRRLEALGAALDVYEAWRDTGFEPFARAVDEFVADQLRHLSAEETTVFPAAKAHLRAEDWAEIAAAFDRNGDPRFAAEPDEQVRELFSRIANLGVAAA